MALLQRLWAHSVPNRGFWGCHRRLATYGAGAYEPHRVLGVHPGCTDAELKAAYRRLALKHHPDTLADSSIDDAATAAARFARITEAYEILQSGRLVATTARTSGKRGQQRDSSRQRSRQPPHHGQSRATASSAGSVRPSHLTGAGVTFAGVVITAAFCISHTSSAQGSSRSLPSQSAAASRPAVSTSLSAPPHFAQRPIATGSAVREPVLAATAAHETLAAVGSVTTAAAAVSPIAVTTIGTAASVKAKLTHGRSRSKVRRAYGTSYLPHNGPGRGAKSPYGNSRGSAHGGSGYKLKPRPAGWIEPTRRQNSGYRDAAALAREKAASARGE